MPQQILLLPFPLHLFWFPLPRNVKTCFTSIAVCSTVKEMDKNSWDGGFLQSRQTLGLWWFSWCVTMFLKWAFRSLFAVGHLLWLLFAVGSPVLCSAPVAPREQLLQSAPSRGARHTRAAGARTGSCMQLNAVSYHLSAELR